MSTCCEGYAVRNESRTSTLCGPNCIAAHLTGGHSPRAGTSLEITLKAHGNALGIPIESVAATVTGSLDRRYGGVYGTSAPLYTSTPSPANKYLPPAAADAGATAPRSGLSDVRCKSSSFPRTGALLLKSFVLCALLCVNPHFKVRGTTVGRNDLPPRTFCQQNTAEQLRPNFIGRYYLCGGEQARWCWTCPEGWVVWHSRSCGRRWKRPALC